MVTEDDVRRIAPTTPHYDGYPAVLVNLPAIDVELRELITESWLLRAPKRVRQAHEADLVEDPGD